MNRIITTQVVSIMKTLLIVEISVQTFMWIINDTIIISVKVRIQSIRGKEYP